jgi:hypothetical protein
MPFVALSQFAQKEIQILRMRFIGFKSFAKHNSKHATSAPVEPLSWGLAKRETSDASNTTMDYSAGGMTVVTSAWSFGFCQAFNGPTMMNSGL